MDRARGLRLGRKRQNECLHLPLRRAELLFSRCLAESEPKTAGAKFCPRSRRVGSEGWDLWVESAGAEKTRNVLAADYRAIDESEWEVLRVENGIPRWGRELTPEIIPPEANLQARAIDYEKGCYIGQEVISRIKMSGQINKRLCGLVSVNDSPLIPGMRLASGTEERKEVGWVTSAAQSQSLGKEIGLGYVKRGFNSTGSRLEAFILEDPMVTARLEIVDLPFVR
ncbi:MAG: hypothetical protein DMF30_00675 [Verrucomicrobia bacterium]|nr:MAG: hypothetical protein DMF30_00675 [Verrucomicrobiota bacterium]